MGLKLRHLLLIAPLLIAPQVFAAPSDATRSFAAVESAYADWLDAKDALSTIDSGLTTRVSGRGLKAWTARLKRSERRVEHGLREFGARGEEGLADPDRRALAAIRNAFAARPPGGPEAMSPHADCADAGKADASEEQLTTALYACFDSKGHVEFENRRIDRQIVMGLLVELDGSVRRAALLKTLEPLWAAINGDDSAQSPYRRLIGFATATGHRARIAEAAATLGISQEDAEQWLVSVLEAWHAANPGPPIALADYWYHYGAASRMLAPHLPAASLQPTSLRFYRDLGANLDQLHVLHDLGVRPGKAPISYEDTVRIGRQTPSGWRPAIVRVSVSLDSGGIAMLNELVHEYGHAVHDAAIRARPAFFDSADLLFTEAFADVPSWSTAEPVFQAKYVGASASLASSLRDHYSRVVLDVCWGLFELRLLRSPGSDPDEIWTDITSRYLNIAPEPHRSWWAMRAQLVQDPGYMIYYALGAIVTADLRAHIRGAIGPFDTGNPTWYGYVSAQLLRHGGEIEARRLLEDFLGRPLSPDALLKELERIRLAGE